MRQAILLLALITPAARACFDTTRGGCFTAPSYRADGLGHLGAREVVGRHGLLREVRQDALRLFR